MSGFASSPFAGWAGTVSFRRSSTVQRKILEQFTRMFGIGSTPDIHDFCLLVRNVLKVAVPKLDSGRGFSTYCVEKFCFWQ